MSTSQQKNRGESLGVQAWKRLRKNPGAVTGLVILSIMSVMAIFAPLISPFDPSTQILEYMTKPPGFRGKIIYKTNPSAPEKPSIIAVSDWTQKGDTVYYHDPAGQAYQINASALAGSSPDQWYDEPLFLFGTDGLGRDLLTRLIYGMRVSLSVGIIAESIALLLGILIGSLAGYFRGWVDDGLLWLISVVSAFPTLILVIVFSVILGKGYWQTFIAIGVSSWVDIARIVRGQFFSIREQEYVEATRAFGFGNIRTIFVHMLPNALGPVIVLATAGFASSIISEASLSFIGLGVQPPISSWGQIIKDGLPYLQIGTVWTILAIPCVIMSVAVLAVNLLGDGLRDAMDPKTSQR